MLFNRAQPDGDRGRDAPGLSRPARRRWRPCAEGPSRSVAPSRGPQPERAARRSGSARACRPRCARAAAKRPVRRAMVRVKTRVRRRRRRRRRRRFHCRRESLLASRRTGGARGRARSGLEGGRARRLLPRGGSLKKLLIPDASGRSNDARWRQLSWTTCRRLCCVFRRVGSRVHTSPRLMTRDARPRPPRDGAGRHRHLSP